MTFSVGDRHLSSSSRNIRFSEAKGQTKVRRPIPPYPPSLTVVLYGNLRFLSASPNHLQSSHQIKPIHNLTHKSNCTMANSWSKTESKSWDTGVRGLCNSGMRTGSSRAPWYGVCLYAAMPAWTLGARWERGYPGRRFLSYSNPILPLITRGPWTLHLFAWAFAFPTWNKRELDSISSFQQEMENVSSAALLVISPSVENH